MQDVSRVTGEPVLIESKVMGRTFVLKGMTFEDLGVVQKKFLRDKKLRHLEAAQLRAELEPPEARKAIMDQAQAEAAQMAYLSDEEFDQTIRTVFGSTELLWVLFQRQYPGVVSRDDIIRMASAGDLPETALASLASELAFGSPEGNSTGQSGSAT